VTRALLHGRTDGPGKAAEECARQAKVIAAEFLALARPPPPPPHARTDGRGRSVPKIGAQQDRDPAESVGDGARGNTNTR